jgi:pectate lyase
VAATLPVHLPGARPARSYGWAALAITLALFLGLAPGCKSQPATRDGCSVASPSCPYVAGLLAQREGYGRNASGGLNGPVVVVTSTADSGPGSLRDIVQGAHGPLWVRFGRDMTIPLQSEIRVRPNLTIDGRGHMITLIDHGFAVGRVNNVILTHLTIDGRSETLGKGVIIAYGSRDIWVDHLDLSRFNDRLIDVKEGATDVTLSWIKFHDDNKVMLLNNIVDASDPIKNLFKDYDRDSASRVTLHHNYFVNTIQRNPRAAFGSYHIFNNVLENWDFYGMSFILEAKVLLEGNIFDNRTSRPCLEPPSFQTIEGVDRSYCQAIAKASERAVMPIGKADQDLYDQSNAVYHYGHEARAFLVVRDNLTLHDAQLQAADYEPEKVPKPPYCYSYQAASIALEDQIRREAGNTPYDTTLPLTRCP